MWRRVELSAVAGQPAALPAPKPSRTMDATLVWYLPRNAADAKARVAALRASGHVAQLRNAKFFALEPCARAVCDPAAPHVAEAYREAGVPVEVWGDEAPPSPDDGGDGLPALPDGYRVEKSGTWYKLIGPDGEQVGNAKRSEAEARAQAGD